MTLHEQLIRDEGFRAKPYRDTRGNLTIGFGRCLDTKGITRAEALTLFEHDVADAAADVDATWPWAGALDEPRRAVLVAMAFNLGLRGLMGFARMLAAVKDGDFDLAAVEMEDSDWRLQVGERAKRLARQMRTGAWQ